MPMTDLFLYNVETKLQTLQRAKSTKCSARKSRAPSKTFLKRKKGALACAGQPRQNWLNSFATNKFSGNLFPTHATTHRMKQITLSLTSSHSMQLMSLLQTSPFCKQSLRAAGMQRRKKKVRRKKRATKAARMNSKIVLKIKWSSLFWTNRMKM